MLKVFKDADFVLVDGICADFEVVGITPEMWEGEMVDAVEAVLGVTVDDMWFAPH